MRYLVFCIAVLIACSLFAADSIVPEVEGYGALRGVRIDGQLFPIVTDLRVAGPAWKTMAGMTQWQVKDSHFALADDVPTHTGRMPFAGTAVEYRQQIRATPQGIHIHLEATPQADIVGEGLFFAVSLPIDEFSGGEARLVGGPGTVAQLPQTLSPVEPRFLNGQAPAIVLSRGKSTFTAKLDRPRLISVQDDRQWSKANYTAMVTLQSGNLAAKQTITADVDFEISLPVDRTSATLTLDTASPQFTLDGFGGSFVYGADSPVSMYNLQNLRVAWSRVWLPLHQWNPDGAITDPNLLAANDKPGTEIRKAVEISKELQKRKIPYIASTWPVPKWVLENPWTTDPHESGRRIAPDQRDALANSIGSYLVYIKKTYGLEPDLFSFNEPDYGVTVKLTPDEERDIIKRIGARFQSLGLKTRMLLGDVAGPRDTAPYVEATIADPEAMQYVGAVAFHSWGGGTDAHYAAWAAAARKANRPLLVTEAGIDAAAWHYTHIFQEYWYAMGEVKQYQELLRHAQPQGIILWEYSNDYGIAEATKAGDTVDIQPGKRFFFLKQFSNLTPPAAQGLATTSTHPEILFTAFRDKTGQLALHLVNDAAAREITLRGLPAGLASLKATITDSSRNMEALPEVPCKGAELRLTMPAFSMLTLTSK
jgi:O-glycosyl hydrolase